MHTADPRIIALEKQFSQFHIQLFNTLSHAQAAVMTAVEQGQDLTDHNDDYLQLKRDFEVTVAVYRGSVALLDNIKATQILMDNPNVANVHRTQLWAAAVSTLTCDRMLQLIPEDLLDLPEVSGELRQNKAIHLKMWEERLKNH